MDEAIQGESRKMLVSEDAIIMWAIGITCNI